MTKPEDIPIGFFLSRAMLITRAQVSAKLRPLELTLPQYICMQMLKHHPGLSNAELAREAFVSRQAMNTVLHDLEKAGLVARPSTAASGRTLPATLTERGEKLVEEALAHVRAAEDNILSRLGQEERSELKRLLSVAIGPYEELSEPQ